MKRISLRSLFALAALSLSGAAAAAEALPYAFNVDTGNLPSVQRGARDFMNYCSGCHSLKYLRYNRLAQDLEIPEDLLKQNLMFTSDKPGDQIVSAMPAQQAEGLFGKLPPDLTLETRARGPQWVYNYLLTFYLDPKRPTGVNNAVLPNASMPHVLWTLQGWQKLGETKAESEGAGEKQVPTFELVVPGSLQPEEYRKWVGDLVNFMAYAAEPEKAQRAGTGVIVLAYLVLLLLPLSYFLKREYWKDVH